MIRILQVIGAMDRGGAETMLMNLYRAIDRSRIQFDFLVHEQRECDYDQEIYDLGGNIYRLPRLNGLNYFTYRRLCREFFAQHSEHPIVHGHIGSSAAIYLSEAKKTGRVTIAHSHAQSFLTGIQKIGFDFFSRPTRDVADWFFGCSYEAGRDRFGDRVVQGDRFFILDNGIDVERYRCDDVAHERAKHALGLDNLPVVGHVGRLAPEKNHAFLFEAFALLLKQVPNAVLLLVGRGPLEEELKARADDLGIVCAVRFLGVRDDVPELLRAMDVFVLPSTKEGLGMSAVEAQASGVLSIVSTGVPARAMVTGNAKRIPLEAGAAKWADALAQALHEAWSSPRTDCVEQVRSCGFDVGDTARRLQTFYFQLASGMTPSRF